MRRLRWCAVLVALVLVAAACGRGSSKESGGETTTTTGSGSATVTNADFGSLKDVCQKGSPSGSPAQGVTASEITVGTFADPGFAGRPGLTQELFDAGEVFTKWCNDLGGINGRKINLDEHDSALTNVKSEMADACSKDFFLVGGGAVFDQDGAADRLRCLLPDIAGYLVSAVARGADLQVQPVPNGLKGWPIGDFRWLGDKFPDSTKSVGVLTGDLPATKVTADQSVEAVKSLDWKIIYNDVYPAAGPPTWTPYATAVKSAGVKGLIWVGEPENLAKFMQALSDVGYQLDWVRTDANHYDQNLLTVGGAAIHNVFIRSVFWPFEKADQNPASKKYLELFDKYKPNGKSHAYLAEQSFSAWLLFAKAAKECGNDLTRKCVYDNARKVTEWNAGGLHAKTDPHSNLATACFLIEEATPDGFRTPNVKPNDGIFRCDKDGVYTLKGNYGTPATLASVGKSLSDLK